MENLQSEPTKIGLKILINISQAVVEVCDANNDGFIDFEEFKTLIMEAKSAYIEELFKTYDLNLDGFITQVEMRFQKIYLPMTQMPAAFYNLFVTSKNEFKVLQRAF